MVFFRYDWIVAPLLAWALIETSEKHPFMTDRIIIAFWALIVLYALWSTFKRSVSVNTITFWINLTYYVIGAAVWSPVVVFLSAFIVAAFGSMNQAMGLMVIAAFAAIWHTRQGGLAWKWLAMRTARRILR
jgi:hypothetical protein